MSYFIPIFATQTFFLYFFYLACLEAVGPASFCQTATTVVESTTQEQTTTSITEYRNMRKILLEISKIQLS